MTNNTTTPSNAIADYLDLSGKALREAARSFNDERIDSAVTLITEALRHDRPLLVCGNGGSASDAQHITGELVGRFLKERRALNAICLAANTSVMTAWANDYDYADIFARQVEAHGKNGGVLLAISTSGNSANVIRAAQTAQSYQIPVVALTGRGGGELARFCDVLLDVPSEETPFIQQAHICIYHFLCERIEAALA